MRESYGTWHILIGKMNKFSNLANYIAQTYPQGL